MAREYPGLTELGEGRLRFFGLHVYDASVWIPGAAFSAAAPYALEIRYAINIKGRALTERSLKEMRGQGHTDEAKLKRWEAEMDRVFPDLKPGDRLVGVHVPGKEARFYGQDEVPRHRAGPGVRAGLLRHLARREDERASAAREAAAARELTCATSPRGSSAAYGVLGFPLAMAALPIYVHVPHFYADTLGLSLASVGGLLLAARFLDAVQDPLLGWWSDRRARQAVRALDLRRGRRSAAGARAWWASSIRPTCRAASWASG